MQSLVKRTRRDGFTLVEAVIASTVLALMLGAIARVAISGKSAYQEGAGRAALEARARRTIDRIASELTGAGRTTLVPSPVVGTSYSTFEFRHCAGWSGGAIEWEPRERIALVYDPRDPNDGIDNDSNGFVDECQIVLTRDVGGPNEISAAIASSVPEYLAGETANLADDNGNGLVDERGLSMVIDANNTLTLRLSLQALDASRKPQMVTVETAVHLRN